MFDLSTRTKDGRTLLSGWSGSLYNDCGCRISGSVHHYGGDGWQLSIHGPYIHDLYYEERNALLVYLDRLRTQVREVEKRLESKP